MQILELEEGKLRSLKKISVPSPVKCITFSASSLEERHASIGCFGGSVLVYDLNHSELPIYSCKIDSELINAIDGFHSPNEICAASRDGSVCIFDTRKRESAAVRFKHHSAADCWSVSVASTDHRSVFCGFDNGDLALIDLRTCSLSWAENVQDGVCSMDVNEKGVVLATTIGSMFHLFDIDRDIQISKKNTQGTIWCGRQLKKTDYFATTGGASNGALNLYKQKKRTDGTLTDVQLVHKSQSGSQPTLSLSWCQSKVGLCSFVSLDRSVSVGYFPSL